MPDTLLTSLPHNSLIMHNRTRAKVRGGRRLQAYPTEWLLEFRKHLRVCRLATGREPANQIRVIWGEPSPSLLRQGTGRTTGPRGKWRSYLRSDRRAERVGRVVGADGKGEHEGDQRTDNKEGKHLGLKGAQVRDHLA